MFHPTAWLLWWLAALLAALLTQNPLYLTVVLLVAVWVGVSLRGAQPGGPSRPGLGLVLRLGPLLVLFTALFNGLTIHVGTTVLARIPAHIPVLGGPITLEAFAFGLIMGLNLVTLLAIFGTFNLVADYRAMLRMVPGFVFQAGLVTSIALAFVPQTLAALEEIREAQMIRGHRFRGWRDLPPLFLPLLTSGLERSIQLAEAMESRGFGGPRLEPIRPSLWPQVAILCGLFTAVAGVGLLTLTAQSITGVTLLSGGGFLALWGLRRGSRNRLIRRSRYRPPPWERRDLVLASVSAGVAGAVMAINVLRPAALRFYPYPRLSPPPFDPLVGALLLLLVLPVVIRAAPAETVDE